MTRIVLTLSLAAIAAFGLAVPALAKSDKGAGGVSDGPAFYANGEQYRTVGTPTDLSHTGAPAHSFDVIYAFPAGTQMNVAEAAPGDRDFNGGRWMVTPIGFDDYAAAAAAYGGDNGVFDSDTEVQTALDAGVAHLSAPVKYFVCPVIHIP